MELIWFLWVLSMACAGLSVVLRHATFEKPKSPPKTPAPPPPKPRDPLVVACEQSVLAIREDRLAREKFNALDAQWWEDLFAPPSPYMFPDSDFVLVAQDRSAQKPTKKQEEAYDRCITRAFQGLSRVYTMEGRDSLSVLRQEIEQCRLRHLT